MKPLSRSLTVLGLAGLGLAGMTQAQTLPAPDSEEFCVLVQQILASTDKLGANTIFTDMPAYRKSKPMVDPLSIYQVVTYRGERPVMVSCKVKTAAHLRAAYGADAAGEQLYCPSITRLAQVQAVEALQLTDPEAARRAAAFVVDDNEPFMTGRSYLADFPLSYVDEDGTIHLNSPGLFQNYDHWITSLLPDRFQGQSYCHLATVDYLQGLATGELEPGTVMTTADDAPVTPGAVR